jgi:polyphenol oxidase
VRDDAQGLPVLRGEKLALRGFRHGFSTRAGGVSEPPFESADFALLRDPSRLRENLRRLGVAVGFRPEDLHQTRQVHGRVVVVADGEGEVMSTREADALVAEPRSGHAVAVRVADCVPVLLADPATGRVAAVHAGWRGVENGVVDAAVLHMGGEASRFAAAIGPSIGACCFEVGADVGARIAKATDEAVVTRRAGDKAFVDLRAAVRFQLRALGLADDAIEDVPREGACTRCDAARFYSYRRDGDASGRLVAVIVAR